MNKMLFIVIIDNFCFFVGKIGFFGVFESVLDKFCFFYCSVVFFIVVLYMYMLDFWYFNCY